MDVGDSAFEDFILPTARYMYRKDKVEEKQQSVCVCACVRADGLRARIPLTLTVYKMEPNGPVRVHLVPFVCRQSYRPLRVNLDPLVYWLF